MAAEEAVAGDPAEDAAAAAEDAAAEQAAPEAQEPGVVEPAAAAEEDAAGMEPPFAAVAAAPAHAALIDIGNLDFKDLANKRIGKIHSVGTGNAKKATCKVHSRCVCWVTPRIGTPADLVEDLKTWLSEASGESPASSGAHMVSSYRVKVKYGMKPAKPPGVP